MLFTTSSTRRWKAVVPERSARTSTFSPASAAATLLVSLRVLSSVPHQGLAGVLRPAGPFGDLGVWQVFHVAQRHGHPLPFGQSTQRFERVQPRLPIRNGSGARRLPEPFVDSLWRLGYGYLPATTTPDVAHHVEGDAVQPGAQREILDAFFRILPESREDPLEGRLHRVLGGGTIAQQGASVAVELGVMPLHHLFRRTGIAVCQAPCQRIEASH